MKKLIFIGLIFMFLMSFAFSYTAPTFANQDLLIESDSSFYGSSQGLVSIDLNIENLKIDSKDLYIQIVGLESYNVSIDKIKLKDGATLESDKLKDVKKQKSLTKIKWDSKEKKDITLILSFDPEELGIGKEFDIQLVTKEGLIIADLDPFLSGFSYRQQWCLNTDGISLSGNITGDHVIYFDFSGNTDFLANASSDGNGIKQTDLSNNEYDFHFEGTGIDDAWVEVTGTFSSSADTCGYTYYGGNSSLNFEDEAGTYPSSYVSAFHLVTGDDAKDVNDGSVTGATQTTSGKIGSAYSFDGTGDYISLANESNFDYLNSVSATGSVCFWYKQNGAITNYSRYFSKGTYPLQLSMTTNGSGTGIDFQGYTDGGNRLGVQNNTSTTDNAWHYLCGTISSGTFGGFIDSSNASTSATSFGTYIGSANDVAFMIGKDGTGTSNIVGVLDEFKIFNVALSGDEIKLLYNAENLNLVSFSAEETANNTPDLNITSPTSSSNWRGTNSINFNVMDLDPDTTLDVNLFYSSSAGSQTNLIVHDANLLDGSIITCSDYNFLDSTGCSYSWDTTIASDGNYFIDANVSDETISYSTSSDEFIIYNGIIFSDFNLFKVDDFTQNFDITNVSDSNFIFDFSVNYSDFNINSVFANYVLSGGTDANCYGSLRGVEKCGWRTGTDFITWSIIGSSGNDYNVQSSSIETNAYTRTATNVAVKLLSPVTDNYVLNSSQDWVKTFFNGVGVDSNVYYHFHNVANYVGIGSRLLNIYDCNNNTADPTNDAGCYLTAFDSTDSGDTGLNYYSNDSNQIVDVNIPLNVDGNHYMFWNCPSCNNAKYWEVENVGENSNIDMDRHFISTTGLGGFATESATSTTGHFHWLELSLPYVFHWFITANDVNSDIQTEAINLVNIPPKVDYFKDLNQIAIGDSYDVNFVISDAYFSVVADGLVCDLNIFDSSDNEFIVETNVSPVLNGLWSCSFDVNTLAYADGNYYFKAIVRETTTDENYFDTLTRTEQIEFDNVLPQNPTITIVYPNGNEIFTTNTDTPTIIFTLKDVDSTPLYVNLNYSATTGIGSGTAILFEENVITSGVVVCDDSDFTNDTNCSYSWDISGVADGNYYLNMVVSDGVLEGNDVSDGNFNIYTTPPVVSAVVYNEQYINPNYSQRDGNVYFSSTQAFEMTDSEKQNIYLEQVTLILLSIGVIIVIGVYILWKRKK